MGAMPSVPSRFEPLTIELAPGRTLQVRALGGDDVAAVEALYDGLSDADRRLRFFSAFRPSAAFIERWLSEVGHLVVGAFVDGVLVGEAGYAVLDNGNGEVGITVADGWRGWLGPFLLDVLAEAAHGAGVDNLEADIRLENRPMLAMIGRRGAAVIEQPQWSQVRLVMGTGARVPSWPSKRTPGRVRVLVESPAGRWSGLADGEAADRLEVVACPGPAARRQHRCPVLDGGRCPLVDGADEVIVVTGDARDGAFERLADAHRAHADADAPTVHTCGLAGAVGELLRRIAADPPVDG